MSNQTPPTRTVFIQVHYPATNEWGLVPVQIPVEQHNRLQAEALENDTDPVIAVENFRKAPNILYHLLLHLGITGEMAPKMLARMHGVSLPDLKQTLEEERQRLNTLSAEEEVLATGFAWEVIVFKLPAKPDWVKEHPATHIPSTFFSTTLDSTNVDTILSKLKHYQDQGYEFIARRFSPQPMDRQTRDLALRQLRQKTLESLSRRQKDRTKLTMVIAIAAFPREM